MQLVERIRQKMTPWTGRFVSYAGRLQLLRSLILSIVNFWINAYRLPNGCVKELEQVFLAFLWTGLDLNAKKAKLAWRDICKHKAEGGLGIWSMKEANQVSCLKLIWSILSSQPSLWVNWMRINHLYKDSFWIIKGTTNKESCMWKKMLKYRDLAKSFIRVELRDGKKNPSRSTTGRSEEDCIIWMDLGVLLSWESKKRQPL